MAKTVFILGAGASKQGGAPLMREFLDAAGLEYQTNQLEKHERPHFERVFRAVGKLQQVQSKQGSLDLVNIESIFGAFEMAATLGRLPGFGSGDIQELVPSLIRVIVRTLEVSIGFPATSTGTVDAPPPYGDFVRLLVQLKEVAVPRHSVAVLTFNYDAALDWAMDNAPGGIFYGLEVESAASDAIPLLKLHGSVNWFSCDGKGSQPPHLPHIEVAKLPRMEMAGRARASGHDPVPLRLVVRPTEGDGKHQLATVPFIVPPTWSKGEYHRQLGNVWRRAADELAEAQNIFVIGYSLPPSDSFFPLLFGLGTVGDTTLRRLWVFDPNAEVGDRFVAMLGPGALQRFKHFSEASAFGGRRIPMKFQLAIDQLRKEFGLD